MKIIKYILFILFFLILSGEFIQNHYKWNESPPLQGAIKTYQKPTLTMENWLSGNYQDSLMKYFEANLDIHPFLIRLRNQISFSLFKEINVAKVEAGKNNVLYENSYIKSYLGQDFIGEQEITNKVNKLAYIQTELKKINIDLLIIIAPGKPSYFPEFIPTKYDLSKQTITNYDVYTSEFKKQHINYVDCRNYFLKLKPTTKYPLFTRCGVHWSGYGSTVAADTLIKCMEKIRAIDMVDYYTEGGEETSIPRNTDADIGNATNLLYDIPSYSMYYPNIVFKNDSTKVKPNVLIIGDSFVWSWINFYTFFPNLFDEKSAFRYYNQQISFPLTTGLREFSENENNIQEQIKNRDFILFETTDANLNNCGFGFIEQVYDVLKSNSSTTN